MKLSLIQPNTIWEDKEQNLKKLEELILPLFNKTDIVILPEMFSTGFSMDYILMGEPSASYTFEWMRNMAIQGNFGICGSYIIREDNHSYNRFIFVSPSNEFWQYDKRHLFGMGGEQKFFTPGKQKVTFIFREFRISPFICYDLRFPVWSRNRNDTDLILYSANWPEARKTAWNTLLRARAIENQCFVAGVNRVGTDGAGIHYSGQSMLINPMGDVIVTAGSEQEGSATGEIQMNELAEIRTRLPFLNDADDFNISV